MIILRYVILASILWALPSFALAYFSPDLGSAFSYLTIGLLGTYFAINKNNGPLLSVFIILGLTYYFISGFNYDGKITDKDYLIMIIKYLIIIICGAGIVRKTSIEELYVFLLVGATSIIIQAVFFALEKGDSGRFSGFYLNPNVAGAMSLMGFALSFGIKNKILKYIGQLIFTVGGFVTFSRYFLIVWLFINLLTTLISRKNLIILILGALSIITVFAFSSSLHLNTGRFTAIQSFFSGNKTNTESLGEDLRTETWASYKGIIMDKPFFGHGYGKLQGEHFGLSAGVHNAYLLVIGESGIFPFVVIIGLYMFLLIKGYQKFKDEEYKFLLAIVLSTSLLVSHNYFDAFNILFISIFLYINLTEESFYKV